MWEREDEYRKRSSKKPTIFKSGREDRRERRKQERKRLKK